jgi:hypothetical protein
VRVRERIREVDRPEYGGMCRLRCAPLKMIEGA